jgi:uncharacterized integral membrane protein
MTDRFPPAQPEQDPDVDPAARSGTASAPETNTALGSSTGATTVAGDSTGTGDTIVGGGSSGGSSGTGPEAHRAPKPTLAGRTWTGLTIAVIVLILLIIFIAENTEKAHIKFLGLTANFPLGLALLVAAIAGALIMVLVGTTRILQLRLEARRNNRRARKLSAG